MKIFIYKDDEEVPMVKKNYLIPLFLIALFFNFSVQTINANESTEKVIVYFNDDVDEQLILSVGGEIEKTYNNFPVAVVEMTEDAVEKLQQAPNVLSVEEDHIVSINNQKLEWGVSKVNAPQSWQSGYTGKGIKVAVVDTGIANHDDLKIAGGVSLISSSYIDENGHGTHVAGIIAAQNNNIGVVGVAPDVQLYAVKVLDKNGLGTLSNVIDGIDWSITNNMDIINLSLGNLSGSDGLQSVVDRAYQNGILLVGAGGNRGRVDGSGNTVEFPARYESVIAVAATDKNNKRGTFSATGSTIEVAAPGVGILSTHLNNRYATLDGTSMAAGYVSGVLALLKEANPMMTNDQLRSVLQRTALDIGVADRDSFYGFGLVQAPFVQGPLVLKEGDRRPEVIQLKIDLEKAGFKVSATPTDFFGPVTTTKVKEFQSTFNLTPNGEVDEETWNTIRKVISGEISRPDTNVRILQEGDRRPEVVQLKVNLERVGFKVSDNPTNFYGSVTTARVEAFQLAYGLPGTGVANEVTLKRLKEVAAVSFMEGDRLPGVIELKVNLEKAGYRVSATPTNFYGSVTTAKVREFQRENRLRVTGVACLITQEKIKEVAFTLKEGDRRAEVIELKILLERAGFRVPGNTTNYYGPLTTEKVREFQYSVGLRVTGIADIQTQERLRAVAVGLMAGDRKQEVIQLKLDLDALGFGVSDNPTNYYGPITASMVKQFQRDYGLEPTGTADNETLEVLQSILESR